MKEGINCVLLFGFAHCKTKRPGISSYSFTLPLLCLPFFAYGKRKRGSFPVFVQSKQEGGGVFYRVFFII